MSFGFGVGDFLAVSNIAKGVYEACKDGPREYKEISREAKSMGYVINSLSDDAQDPHSLLNKKGVRRKPELVEIIRNCETTMQELQAMVDKHSSLGDGHGKFTRVWDAYKVGSSDLDSLRGKLTFYPINAEPTQMKFSILLSTLLYPHPPLKKFFFCYFKFRSCSPLSRVGRLII